MLLRQTTTEERARHVARMRTNFALEDIHPQTDDLNLQQHYIAGEISLADMLQHARDFALRSANPNRPSER